MKTFFEHTVEIPEAIGRSGFSRESLWIGLSLFVNEPALFIPEIEKVVIDEVTSEDDVTFKFNREIHYPQFKIEDRVEIDDGFEIVTHVKKGPTWPESRFTISMDNQQTPAIKLTFKYEEDEEAYQGEPDMVHQLRQQAYVNKDRHLVDQIIRMYQDGELL